MLPRTLEPEVMDTAEEAADYDAMDHAAVNRAFVTDLLQLPGLACEQVLDLGAGTALIPIELCRRAASARVVAVDAARQMLRLGARNLADARLGDRVTQALADAKRLPFLDRAFTLVMTNSLLHHLPQPGELLAEMLRVARPGGWLFARDLLRPESEAELERLVGVHAAGASPRQQRLLADSLRAAVTEEELRAMVHRLGLQSASVARSSDRHWTWAARVP